MDGQDVGRFILSDTSGAGPDSPGTFDLVQEFLRAVPDLVPGGMDDPQAEGREKVAPVQVVLPVEPGGVVGPAVGLDDDRRAHQLEVGAGHKVATLVGDNELLEELEAGPGQQPPRGGLKLGG